MSEAAFEGIKAGLIQAIQHQHGRNVGVAITKRQKRIVLTHIARPDPILACLTHYERPAPAKLFRLG